MEQICICKSSRTAQTGSAREGKEHKQKLTRFQIQKTEHLILKRNGGWKRKLVQPHWKTRWQCLLEKNILTL